MHQPTSKAALALLLATGGCYEGATDSRELEPRELGHGWFQVAGEMQLLEYEIVDGRAMFEGDVVLGEIADFTAVELGEREPDRGAVLPGRQWKNGVLFYSFDKNLPAAGREAVAKAIATLEARTVVRFIERTDQKDHVRIFQGEGCWSNSFGRKGGKQEISLGIGCQSETIAIHELGHALGLFHEQSRSDRDEHVTVLWDNIAEKDHFQFQTFIEMGKAGANVGEYDFDSIMHYEGHAFGKQPGMVTIMRKDGTPIRYNSVLSAGDVAAIDALHVEGPSACGNGVVDGYEACDFGEGNDAQARYRGGDGDYCGWDPQEVCEAGCGHTLTREAGELGNCDIHDGCNSSGIDCWMSASNGGCVCTPVCGNGWLEDGEACDFGEGNRDAAIYRGGDGAACGPDPQSVCEVGCSAELSRWNGGLADCDVGDECSAGLDCWMAGDGACACS